MLVSPLCLTTETQPIHQPLLYVGKSPMFDNSNTATTPATALCWWVPYVWQQKHSQYTNHCFMLVSPLCLTTVTHPLHQPLLYVGESPMFDNRNTASTPDTALCWWVPYVWQQKHSQYTSHCFMLVSPLCLTTETQPIHQPLPYVGESPMFDNRNTANTPATALCWWFPYVWQQ